MEPKEPNSEMKESAANAQEPESVEGAESSAEPETPDTPHNDANQQDPPASSEMESPAETHSAEAHSVDAHSDEAPSSDQPSSHPLPEETPSTSSHKASEPSTVAESPTITEPPKVASPYSAAVSRRGFGSYLLKHLNRILAIFALLVAGTALGITLADDGSESTIVEVPSAPFVAFGESQNGAEQFGADSGEEVIDTNPDSTSLDMQEESDMHEGSSVMKEDFEQDRQEPLSSSLNAIVERLLPSAVTVTYSYSIQDASLGDAGSGVLGNTGSGVIYDEQGLIITAAHVVTVTDNRTNELVEVDDAEVLVQLNSGDTVKAEVVGLDRAIDIAVLRFDPSGLQFEVAKAADLSTARAGDLVISIGSPFDLNNSTGVGYIGALDRVIRAPSGPDSPIQVPAIQTDSTINSGNSGGMLANKNGEVLGINVQNVDTSAFGQVINAGIGFAVPIDLALSVAEKILLGEEFVYGSLGMKVESSRLLGLGVEVIEVDENTAADRAGLRVGDRIISYNSERILNARQLVSKIQFTEPGTRVVLGILRNGQSIEVEATIDESEIESETRIYS